MQNKSGPQSYKDSLKKTELKMNSRIKHKTEITKTPRRNHREKSS